MEYSQFIRLVDGGEKVNIDFKIQCNAFNTEIQNNKAELAELAKDICAMANNGNTASHIVIGVSDDGLSFRSVVNPKLTEDRLQDFCKKSIFPPPTIKLFRKIWARANPPHANLEFVIIQIGPNKKLAFRLNQDFIHYQKGVCYRRNEVWIRRGATSDLATPEEIAQLLKGKPIEDTKEALKQKVERKKFALLSDDEQKGLISSTTITLLKKCGYSRLPPKEWIAFSPQDYGVYTIPASWKMSKKVLMLLYYRNCFNNLFQKDIRNYFLKYVPRNYSRLTNIPTRIINKQIGHIESIRNVWLFPVISSVPRTRIKNVLPNWRWGGINSHYYLPKFQNIFRQYDNLPSSNELLVLDGLSSLSDYKEYLIKTIEYIENIDITIIQKPE